LVEIGKMARDGWGELQYGATSSTFRKNAPNNQNKVVISRAEEACPQQQLLPKTPPPSETLHNVGLTEPTPLKPSEQTHARSTASVPPSVSATSSPLCSEIEVLGQQRELGKCFVNKQLYL
jgi:hypothetical protein